MADSWLLSHDDLVELTGYRRPCDHIRWLRDQHIRFLVGGDGRPKVLRVELENQMVTRARGRQPWKPRLDLTPGAGRTT